MATPSRVIERREQIERERRHLELVRGSPDVQPDVTIRTCTSCGEHTAFVRDRTDPTWYSCSACGHYA